MLEGGALPLLGAVVATILRAPVRFARALAIALRMSRRSPRSWPYHLVYLAEAAWLCRQLRAAGVDHLHAHFGTNGAEVALLARELGGPPYSFTVHGPEEFDAPESLHLRTKSRKPRSSSRSARSAAASSSAGSPSTSGRRCESCTAASTLQFDSEPGNRTVAARLVCVGRLCEQKGQLLLLDAVRIVIDRGRALSSSLPATASCGRRRSADRRARPARCVGITGWIDSERVRAEMLAARALVLPSFAEGLPVVIMEAMALRRPVLSTFVAGIAELVRPGLDGWLVPAGDVHALADALEECLETPAPILARMATTRRSRRRTPFDRYPASKLAELFRDGAIRPAATPG